MKCELCNADPMTANCNNANCMTKHTDTDELRWACLNEDCMVDNDVADDLCTACGCTKDFISPRIEARFTAYTTNREREAYKKGYIDGGIAELTKRAI